MRPEEIIKGSDPVSVNLLRQIYAALKDRSTQNLDLMERCWVMGIEKAYTDKKESEHLLMESIIKQATEILDEDKSWDSKKEQFYAMLEKIVFLKAREDVFMEFFDHVETAISAAMQMDFSKRVPLTTLVSNDKANILNYAATMVNMLIETLEYSVVSVKSVNATLASIPGIVSIITDGEGNIRFVSDLGEKLLDVEHNNLIGTHISTVLTNYASIETQLKSKGKITAAKVDTVLKGHKNLLVAATLTVPELYKNWNEVEEIVYTLKFDEADIKEYL